VTLPPSGFIYSDPFLQRQLLCIFQGWLPVAVIDQAMSGALLQYYKLLCDHYADFVDQSGIT